MSLGGLYARMAELADQGASFVLVTVTAVTGSAPRGVGAKMLVLEDGSSVETIGGGVLEQEAIGEARACLASGTAHSATYQLRKEGEHALGALCGGEVTVFFEPHGAARELLIIGAGHIGQKLSAFGAMLDYVVTVLDSRQDMLTGERFPDAAQLLCGEPARAAELRPIGAHTRVVIVTHSAEHDEAALRAVLTSPAPYIGMIGSSRKIRTVFERLRNDGVAQDQLDRVHAPVGLDIGAETPAELALCIMAEIVAAENGKLAGGPRRAERAGARETAGS